jgi:hypothetical protein
MTFLDLLIIYLSLGAPFGAYLLVRNERPVEFRGALSAVTAILIWPAYVVRSAFRYLGSSNENTAFDADAGPDAKLLEQIESLTQQFSDAARPSHRLVARQVEQSLERYVELSIATLTKTATRKGQYFDLLTVSGHPSLNSGSVCLNRRNRNVIERHLTNARKELVTALDDLSSGRQDAKEVVKMIADLLNDKELASAVSTNLNSPREQSNTKLNQWETSKPQHKPIYNGEALGATTPLD